MLKAMQKDFQFDKNGHKYIVNFIPNKSGPSSLEQELKTYMNFVEEINNEEDIEESDTEAIAVEDDTKKNGINSEEESDFEEEISRNYSSDNKMNNINNTKIIARNKYDEGNTESDSDKSDSDSSSGSDSESSDSDEYSDSDSGRITD